jgi:hypothetical protein
VTREAVRTSEKGGRSAVRRGLERLEMAYRDPLVVDFGATAPVCRAVDPRSSSSRPKMPRNGAQIDWGASALAAFATCASRGSDASAPPHGLGVRRSWGLLPLDPGVPRCGLANERARRDTRRVKARTVAPREGSWRCSCTSDRDRVGFSEPSRSSLPLPAARPCWGWTSSLSPPRPREAGRARAGPAGKLRQRVRAAGPVEAPRAAAAARAAVGGTDLEPGLQI